MNDLNAFWFLVAMTILWVMAGIWIKFESMKIDKIPERKPRIDIREADLKKKFGSLV